MKKKIVRLASSSLCLVALNLAYAASPEGKDIPLAGYPSNLCSTTSGKVNQMVSDNLDSWGGTIRLLDWVTEKHQVDNSLTPQVFPSVIDAINSQKGKTGEKLVLGEAFPVYVLSSEKIRNHKSGKDSFKSGKGGFLSLTESTGVWLVPAFIGEKPVSVVEVNCTGDRLEIAGVGSKPLAEALTAFKNSTKVVLKEHRFVRTYYPPGHFIATSQDKGEVVYPLSFVGEYSGIQPTDEEGGYTPDDIMAVLGSKLLNVEVE
jgi:hypothetical protein